MNGHASYPDPVCSCVKRSLTALQGCCKVKPANEIPTKSEQSTLGSRTGLHSGRICFVIGTIPSLQMRGAFRLCNSPETGFKFSIYILNNYVIHLYLLLFSRSSLTHPVSAGYHT